MINKNKLFRQAHIYLSLFFLPCAFLFAITGMGYIFGLDDKAGMSVQKFTTQSENENLEQVLIDYLKQNKLSLPENKIVKVKNAKPGSVALGNTHYTAMIHKISENTYEISTQTRNLYGMAVMLHKDKAGWYFSVMSVGFGLCLIMLYISGLIITFFASKKDRNKQLLTFIGGLLVTLILAYVSI